MHFGELLQNERVMHGLTQQQVADAVGIHLRAYQRYEYNTRKPSFEALLAIADFFDVSLDYLVGRCLDSECFKASRLHEPDTRIHEIEKPPRKP